MKIINTTDNKGLTMTFFNTEIKCTKASIYYIDNKPFIDWYGVACTSNGYIIEVHIPKMSLDIQQIDIGEECLYSYDSSFLKSRQVLVKDGFKPDEDIIVTIKEREMTKEQIENELGYKIKIKD